jgi:nitrilase
MVSTDNIDENLKEAERLINEAASQGAGLLVLPENFALFASGRQLQCALDENDNNGRRGKIDAFLAEIAERWGVWIVAGSTPCAAANRFGDSPLPRVFAACHVYRPDGEIACRYDKIHLFDVDVGDVQGRYAESEHYAPGKEAVFFDLPEVRVGLSICYDLRFPELYRYLFQQGCQVFTVPAAFTYKTGKAHWLTLLKARAIENNAYVIAANQGGHHSASRQTYGHSCIISPWGEVLSCLPHGAGVVLATFDSALQEGQRRAFPLAQHQRLFVKP